MLLALLTRYEGGIFTTILKFPGDFPNNPPEMRFETEMWHPNIYPDGRVGAASDCHKSFLYDRLRAFTQTGTVRGS